jgi:hypothetical protein
MGKRHLFFFVMFSTNASKESWALAYYRQHLLAMLGWPIIYIKKTIAKASDNNNIIKKHYADAS